MGCRPPTSAGLPVVDEVAMPLLLPLVRLNVVVGGEPQRVACERLGRLLSEAQPVWAERVDVMLGRVGVDGETVMAGSDGRCRIGRDSHTGTGTSTGTGCTRVTSSPIATRHTDVDTAAHHFATRHTPHKRTRPDRRIECSSVAKSVLDLNQAASRSTLNTAVCVWRI